MSSIKFVGSENFLIVDFQTLSPQFDNEQREPASQSVLADQTLAGEEGARTVHLHYGPGRVHQVQNC